VISESLRAGPGSLRAHGHHPSRGPTWPSRGRGALRPRRVPAPAPPPLPGPRCSGERTPSPGASDKIRAAKAALSPEETAARPRGRLSTAPGSPQPGARRGHTLPASSGPPASRPRAPQARKAGQIASSPPGRNELTSAPPGNGAEARGSGTSRPPGPQPGKERKRTQGGPGRARPGAVSPPGGP
jgi:hypothetical protein